MKKKILSILLIVCMVLTLAPPAVFAESGTCGDNVTWILDGDTLTISGTGDMADFNDVPWSSRRAQIKTVVIESGVTSIGKNAFCECINLESITIPDSVTSIGVSAFFNCTGLTSITIPEGVTSIGDSAFYYCEDLTSVSIPKGVTSIGWYAFFKCTNLESITFEKDSQLKRIEQHAFDSCTSLTSVSIPEGVTSIDSYAFCECTGLRSVEIPDSVGYIGECAFYKCTSLTSIFLPDNCDASWADIPNATSQVRYSLKTNPDTDKVEVTITIIDLGTGKTSVAIPATICGYDVVAISDESLLNKISSHTCAGGQPTCQTKAICGICKQEYGEKNPNKHTGTKVWEQNETRHKQYWNCCDAVVVDYQDHTWSNGVCSVCDYTCVHKDESPKDHECDICDETISQHTGGEATCTSKAICEYCGKEYGDLADHTFSGNTCTVCGYTSSSGSSTSSSGGFSGTYNYPVRVDSTSSSGAAVTLDKTNAVAGDKVTITVTPDAGKAVDEVIVTDADGKAIAVTKAGDNQYTFTMPAGKVNIAVTTKAADYQNKIVLQIGNCNILENNKTITNDVAPIIVDNRTMVPIRVITEILGGTAHWNADTQTVTLNIDGRTLTMTIGQTISGFDTAPIIRNDRTYVPVWYVAEMLGASVEWIGTMQQIIITK